MQKPLKRVRLSAARPGDLCSIPKTGGKGRLGTRKGNYGRVSHVSGQALSRLVVLGRDGIPLNHRKFRVPPTEQDLDQPAVDFLFGRQSGQQAVPKQQHDLDGIRPENREDGAVLRDKPVGSQTVNIRQ